MHRMYKVVLLTYDDAVNWAVDNVPANQFNTFEEWRNQVESELMTPELSAEGRFQQMLQDKYFGLVEPQMEEQVFVEEGTFEELPELPELPTMIQREQHIVEIKEEFRKENIQETAKRFAFTQRQQPSIAERFTQAKRRAMQRIEAEVNPVVISGAVP